MLSLLKRPEIATSKINEQLKPSQHYLLTGKNTGSQQAKKKEGLVKNVTTVAKMATQSQTAITRVAARRVRHHGKRRKRSTTKGGRRNPMRW